TIWSGRTVWSSTALRNARLRCSGRSPPYTGTSSENGSCMVLASPSSELVRGLGAGAGTGPGSGYWRADTTEVGGSIGPPSQPVWTVRGDNSLRVSLYRSRGETSPSVNVWVAFCDYRSRACSPRGLEASALPKVVVHIGEPKTGTTFLQQVMWRNRAE